MKKVLSLILCLTVLLSTTALFAFAQEDSINVIVANDLHYNLIASNADKVPKRNSISEDYAHAASSMQLYSESYAIIVAFLEKAATLNGEYLILPGDLVDDGTVAENVFFASLIKEFEVKSGKKVFVVPGNHDLFETTPDEFMTIYADFGYNEAIARDTLSASYVAELGADYRLLAIDSTDPGESNHGMTAARVEWIKAQAAKAKADGKKVIAMMHHNLVEHFILGDVIRDDAVVNDDIALGEVFAQNGVKYVFTGHTHEHDIAAYTSEDGTEIYDVVTGALNVYPCPYRVVTFGESVEIKTGIIDKIDTSLVPAGISETAAALMESDFTQYTKNCAEVGLRQTITSYTKASMLKKLLKLDKTEDAEMCAIIDKVGTKLNEAIQMPFYKSQEVTEGLSVESIVSQHDITLPSSKYTDMVDLASEVYFAHVAGDENYPAYKNEVVLLSRGLSATLTYALSDVTAEEYAQVLTFVTELLGVSVPADFLAYAGDTFKRFEGIEIVVTTAIVPVLTQFTVDETPADSNVVLPGYAQTMEDIEEEKSFWQKIEEFFIKIFEAIMSIFAFVG